MEDIFNYKDIVFNKKETINFIKKLLEYIILKEKEYLTSLVYVHREFDTHVSSYEYISNMDQIAIKSSNLYSAKILDIILNYLVTGNEYLIETLFLNYDNDDEDEELIPKTISQIFEDFSSSDNGFLEILEIPINIANNKGRKYDPYIPFSEDFSIPKVCKIWTSQNILEKLI